MTIVAFMAGIVLAAATTFLVTGISKNNAITKAYQEGYRKGLDVARWEARYDKVC